MIREIDKDTIICFTIHNFTTTTFNSTLVTHDNCIQILSSDLSPCIVLYI